MTTPMRPASTLQIAHGQAAPTAWLLMANLEQVAAFQSAGRIVLRNLGSRKAFATRSGHVAIFYSSSSSGVGTLYQAFSAVAVLHTGFCQLRSPERGIQYEAAAVFLPCTPVRIRQLASLLHFIDEPRLWARSLPRVIAALGDVDRRRICRSMGVALDELPVNGASPALASAASVPQ